MPQLLPFFFINQFVWSFAALMVMVYLIGKYIIPAFTLTNVSRLYVTKL